MPVPVAAQSFDCSNTEIMGLNPAWDMDVCPRFSVFLLSCVGSDFATGVLPNVKK
jgi:hypothetical protein